MNNLFQDIRYGLRMLVHSPGFTAIAVLTLALGIGANTAIFSVINSVLLEPLPFKDPGQLVSLGVTESAPGNFPLTGPDYLDWHGQSHTFAAMSLYGWSKDFSASGTGEPESASVILTQGNFFDDIGVAPLLGRSFATGEDEAGKNHVAILSYGFWQRHFGGSADAIGKTIELNDEAYTVIGVMPRWYNFPAATDIWAPLDMDPKNLGGRGTHQWRALGRVKTGVSIAQARADLETIGARLAKQYPDNDGDAKPLVTPLKDRLIGNTGSQLLILFGAVGLVLLVACANVANLLLVRATGRQREIAVRAALGASRWRLARQMLTESVLLSLFGAALGLAGAWWCVRLLATAKNVPVQRAIPLHIDGAVLGFTVLVAVLVGILFGLAPALQGWKRNLSEELKSSANAVVSPTGGGRIVRDALVVCEIALSLALLVGAGLLLRSFAKMRTANIGVSTKNILTFDVALPEAKYPTLAARAEFFQQLQTRLQQIPGVVSAAATSELPLEGGNNGYITVPGNTDKSVQEQLVEWGFVSPDYFRALSIPFYEGRNFTDADSAGAVKAAQEIDAWQKAGTPAKSKPTDVALVAVINRAMAETFWPHQDALGKEFLPGATFGFPVKVIGVVGNVKQWGITEKPIPQSFLPVATLLQFPGFGVSMVMKTAVPPTSVLGAVRSSVAALDPSLAVFHPRTMEQVIADNMQGTSFQTFLLGVFAALALLLAAVGIYGVMAYLVTQRTHEIGIRMALGAQRGDVMRLVLGQGMKLTAIGVAAGIAAALGLTRLLAAALFGVSATDPETYVAVALLLALVALAACYIPARRAVRVDPMVALRYE